MGVLLYYFCLCFENFIDTHNVFRSYSPPYLPPLNSEALLMSLSKIHVFPIFLYLSESNPCCPYIHEDEVILWSMIKLPEVIPLKKTDSPTVCSLSARSDASFHVQLECWLACSRADNDSWCAFVSSEVLLWPESAFWAQFVLVQTGLYSPPGLAC